MKKLLRPRCEGSPAGYLNPSQIHSTKTGRGPGRTCRKSLIINDQILYPPPKSSGNVRFCTFTPPIPNLSGVIRSFALKPVLQGWQEWKTRTLTPALTSGATPAPNTPNRCTVLHRVAVCCTVLRAKSFGPQVQHLRFPDRAGQVYGGTAGMRLVP